MEAKPETNITSSVQPIFEGSNERVSWLDGETQMTLLVNPKTPVGKIIQVENPDRTEGHGYYRVVENELTNKEDNVVVHALTGDEVKDLLSQPGKFKPFLITVQAKPSPGE